MGTMRARRVSGGACTMPRFPKRRCLTISMTQPERSSKEQAKSLQTNKKTQN
jgi:hypothetical protein